MAATYPSVIAPQWDLLEANAVLGTILTAENVTEAAITDQRERGGDTEDLEGHLVMLISAELGLRAAMEVER